MTPHPAPGPVVDAIVLTGGRSSRLGGLPKHTLHVDGISLLARTLQAASAARRTVVVGPAGPETADDLSVLATRESPAYAGPAAAIAAGLAALEADARQRSRATAHPEPGRPAELVLVLACDMPRVAELVPALRGACQTLHDNPAVDGALAHDRGHDQPLAAVYRTRALSDAVAALDARGALTDASLRSVTAALRLAQASVPPGVCDDCDTWADAARLGASRPPQGRSDATTKEKP